MNSEASPSSGRYRVLAAGFFGWMLAGVQLGVTSIVMPAATQDVLQTDNKAEVGPWIGWLVAWFLLGGAAGGYVLGFMGDRIGRKKAMALSIATYSVFAGLTCFVDSPWQLLIMRFMTGVGVGGMWPNGIALVSEAWPGMSRPMLAGVIGTAANVGIMMISLVMLFAEVSHDNWHWVMQLTTLPIFLAVFVWVCVPESARWMAAVGADSELGRSTSGTSPQLEVFQPPMLRVTILGIILGTIPLFGGWGSANWANVWAASIGDKQVETTEKVDNDEPRPDDEAQAESSGVADKPKEDTGLKARVLLARSGPGSLASLLGGVVAAFVGRRRFYFFLAIACLACSQYVFLYSQPGRSDFLWAVAALGLFSGFFFGWLPLCLPELFPTRVRATGAGISFNFGRIATAVGILVAAGFLKSFFDGDYARIGQLTSWIYAVGAVAILFAPDMGQKGLED